MRSSRGLVPGVLAMIFASVSLPAATQETQELEELWPHAPGARWSYDRIEILWGAATKSAAATVLFTLGDSTVVGGSIAVQPLVVDVAGTALETGPAFWRQLAIARPDLGAPVVAWRPTDAASSGLVIHDAVLLRVAPDEIAAYRDTPTMRAWLYAEPDLTPGHAWRLQLIPDVADSVFLDASVIGSTDVTTPAGSFAATLRVRYDVDYGWLDATDSLGAVVGRTRARTRGEMFYAPGVGPVLARETFVPVVESEGNPPPPPVDSTFAELRLVSHAPGPTAVAGRSWTAMKSRYR